MNSRYSKITDAVGASRLSGLDFEEFLTQLFSDLGYTTEKTSASGDYGGDVLLQKDGKTIVVQAKSYSSSVGFDAVKEVHFARTYYDADEAWVVTTSTYTDQAISGARRASIRLIDGAELTGLIYDAHHNSYSSRCSSHSLKHPVRVISDERKEIVREAKYKQWKSDYLRRHKDGRIYIEKVEGDYARLLKLQNETIPMQIEQRDELESKRSRLYKELESIFASIDEEYASEISSIEEELSNTASYHWLQRHHLSSRLSELTVARDKRKKKEQAARNALLEELDSSLTRINQELHINEERLNNCKGVIDNSYSLFRIPNEYFPY